MADDKTSDTGEDTSVAELLVAVRDVLANFTPFITAWESNDPMSGPDGEDLYERLRGAAAAFEDVT